MDVSLTLMEKMMVLDLERHYHQSLMEWAGRSMDVSLTLMEKMMVLDLERPHHQSLMRWAQWMIMV